MLLYIVSDKIIIKYIAKGNSMIALFWWHVDKHASNQRVKFLILKEYTHIIK